MGKLPLGAAYANARVSGKDQSQSAQRRRANDFLRREGHPTMSRKVAKGILDRWRAMTTDERADEFNLRAAGVPPEVARALAMTGNGKAPKRKPKFGGLVAKMGPTLGELDAAGHTHGLTGSSALRGPTWRKRRRQQKRVDKGGPGSGPRPGGGAKAHLSAAQSHLAAAKVARGKGDHATADSHRQKASERIRAALKAQGVKKAGGWDESKHPRADNGEFGEGGGGSDSSSAAAKPGHARKPRSSRSGTAAARLKPAPKPKKDHRAAFEAEHGHLSAPEHRAKAKEHLDEARGLYSALKERSLSPKVVQQTEFAARKLFAQGKMHEQAADKLDPRPSEVSEHESTVGLPAHEKVAIAHQKGKDARAAYKREDRAEGNNLFKESKRLHEEAAEELASQDGSVAIGRTKSGKPVTMDGRHDSFTKEDHQDALDVHANLLSCLDGQSAARNRSLDALKVHERALEDAQAGIDQAAYLGQTKSGKSIGMTSHVGQASSSFSMQDHIDAGKAHYAAAEKHKPARRLVEQHGRRFFDDNAASRAYDQHMAANKFHNAKAIAMLTDGDDISKSAIAKRHMVSQLASQYIAAAYDPPRLPDSHRQRASERIRAALRAQGGVQKAGNWDESKHPRADNGEFGSGGGGTTSAATSKRPEPTGHTSSGKPIYGAAYAKSDWYGDYTPQDHKDAAKILGKANDKDSQKEHLAEAREKERGSSLRKTSSGKNVYEKAPADHDTYKKFSGDDHFDAAQAHNNQAGRERRSFNNEAKAQQHEKLAEQHLRIAEKHLQPEGVQKLPKEQDDALSGYTGHDRRSADHDVLNAALEGKTVGDKENTAAILAQADHLNAAIASSAIEQPEVFYRGSDMTEVPKVGQVMSTPRLLSVSSDKEIAHKFATEENYRKDAPKNPVIYTIHAAAGTHALNVNKHLYGIHAHEKEHIFGSNQNFRVKAVRHEDGMHHIELETVSEPVKKRVMKAKRQTQFSNRSTLPKPDAAKKRLTSKTGFQVISAVANKALTGGLRKAAIAKRHMVSQLAGQYIQAAYEPPRLPAGDPQYTDPPEFARYLDAQRLVAGMDVELSSGAETPSVARTRASRALATSMGHYDRTIAGPDRAISHVGGLNLDLGSGQSRERGFLGLDTYPFDYGTVVADLGLGIPFPDGSARAVRCWNALGELEDYRDDATGLMREVQRVLTIGGRFYYQGPPLQDIVDWSKLPGLGVVSHQFGDGGRVLTLTLQRQAARLPVVYGADVQQLGRSEASPADMAESLAQFGDLPPADVAMANLVTKGDVRVRASIVKKRDWDRVVLGPILIPDLPDSQNDTMTAEDIEQTAHNFLADARLVGREHSDTWDGAQVVESYIAPCELSFADEMYGPQVVPKGSWILGVRIPEESWADVLDGSVTGFSVGGWGEREDVA